MKTACTIILLTALLGIPAFAADNGPGIDPNGIGSAIDPNGDGGPCIDPDGTVSLASGDASLFCPDTCWDSYASCLGFCGFSDLSCRRDCGDEKEACLNSCGRPET